MPAHTVSVAPAGPTVVVRVSGHLGEAAGGHLVRVAAASAHCGHDRVEVDLAPVTSYDEEGARALGRCRELSRQFARGIGFSSSGRVGRAALLATVAHIGWDEAPAGG